ncbi:putative protein involved in methicillin resistance [Salinivirga cyanobacteriivorans]|uniref:FemAB-related protein, PEP-CTERM system-associated n=1 Tax=Salinivirga cyanobacteriivorans TaxID=1307839 RepID=A0A0S2I0K9_9BACT|nr:peptidoglycan bridge formation glycyltransferase FemA/FemB family protein [Salinivirga cyanobacteriivorans]ALO15771.1 putative protein involved in methicillin resistance [Salinivirga cyanobacteriivorans]
MSQYNICKVSEENAGKWNQLFEKAHFPFYTKSIYYAHVQKLNGRLVETYVVEKKGVSVCGAHFTIKKSLRGFIKTADLVSGITIHKSAAKDDIRFLLEKFIMWAKKQGAAVLRINPWIPLSINDLQVKLSNDIHELLTDYGFRHNNDHLHTYWIDLTKSEKELLSAMKPQTRRKIRKAIKAGFEVEHITKPEKSKIDLFWTAYQKLGHQKDFDTLSYDRFFAEVEALLKTGAVLFFFKFNHTIVNTALATSFGIASYYHGALNAEYKNLEGCPSPGHFVQWYMMIYMKKMGLKTYDMAFCPGPEPIENHPQYNMWRFKYSFRGQHVAFMPSYIKKGKMLLGSLFMWIKK